MNRGERKQMADSLRRLIVFLLPLFLVLMPPVYVLWRSGEFMALDPAQVVALQRQAPSLVLFGPAFSNCGKRYKLLAARAAAADVLVLGTSRSMQIRAGLFLPQTSFYNAGGGVSRIGHYRQFLAELPQSEQPKVLLVGMDQWFFNARTEAYPEAPFESQIQKCSNVLNLVQSSWVSVYRDMASNRISLAAWHDDTDVGLNAQIQRNGFRNDGSYFYGHVTADPTNPAAYEDYHFRETYRRIAEGTGRFEHAQDPDPKLVAELGKFLDEAKRRGIHVLGFIPPYAPSVNDAMTRTGNYGYIPKLYATIKPVFDRRGFVVLDFTDIRALGIDDSGFIDGVHATERSHIRILEALLKADASLDTYTNGAYLEQIEQRSPNPLVLATTRLR